MSERVRLPEATRLALQNLVEGGAPDAFCVLAGPNRFHEARGYVPASFNEGDERSALALKDEKIVASLLQRGITLKEIEEAKKSGLPTGANDRIIAAAAMYDAFPHVDIVTVTRPTDRPEEPTYASVIANGLRRRGVPDEDIFSQGENAHAVNTVTEFKEFARLWKEEGWKNIVFITAKWHVPRAEALFNHIVDFAEDVYEAALLTEFTDAIKTKQLSVQFLDTTQILLSKSPKFEGVLKKVEESPGMKTRTLLEENAVQQIARGSYGTKILTHKISANRP